MFESGKPNEDGSIVGVDADAGAAAYEPHYDVITQGFHFQMGWDVISDDYAAEEGRPWSLSNGFMGRCDRLGGYCDCGGVALEFDRCPVSSHCGCQNAARRGHAGGAVKKTATLRGASGSMSLEELRLRRI